MITAAEQLEAVARGRAVDLEGDLARLSREVGQGCRPGPTLFQGGSGLDGDLQRQFAEARAPGERANLHCVQSNGARQKPEPDGIGVRGERDIQVLV
jgi:hypothetical protein